MNGVNSPRPTGIVAPHGAKIFEISWDDGKTHRIENEILRGFCPCAGCQGHSGTIVFQPGKNHDLRVIKQVGNYALSLAWGDQHDTGIFSFDYLRRLGELRDSLGLDGLKSLENLQRARITTASGPSRSDDE